MRKVVISRQKKIAPDVFWLELASSDGSALFDDENLPDPGQFVNLYLPGKDKLLPRPLSICRVRDGILILVYKVVGTGTRELAACPPGTMLRMSPPLGHGYDITDMTRGKTALLVGGGLGVPPLVELAAVLKERGVAVTAALGFQEDPILAEELESLGARVLLACDAGLWGFAGTVVDLLKCEDMTADGIFACGPRPMLEALAAFLHSRGQDVQVSLEERMGCGYGACLSCSCTTHREDGSETRSKICTDGPVFWGREVFVDD